MVEIIQGSSKPKERFLALDIFRGFTISAMVFVNSIGAYASTPERLRHAEDIGLTFTDLVAPFFIIAIAVTYRSSWLSYKAKEGKINAFVRFLRRYCAFIGLGFIGSISMEGLQPIFRWNVLQAIGLAGVFTLLFIDLDRYLRFVVSIISLVIYQILLEVLFGEIVFNDVHGGFYGGFSWGAMMLLGTVVADLLDKNRIKDYLIYGIIFTALGLILHLIFVGSGLTGISKERVSSSYTVISVGIASLVIYFIYYLYDIRGLQKSRSFFEVQSKNALFLYLIHSIVYGIISLAFPEWSPFWLVLIYSALSITAVWYIGLIMDKKKVYIHF